MSRIAALFLLAFALPAFAADGVKSVELTFEPAEAKPGQTVVCKLTVTLEAKYYTYPLVQTDAQAKSMVNKLEFPPSGELIFVGEAIDPAGGKTKAEPLIGIKEMLYFPESVVYERKAVVSPKAKAGEVKVILPKFTLSVCDADNCFPPQKLKPEAKFKVLDGSVDVEKKFAEEVAKALKDK